MNEPALGSFHVRITAMVYLILIVLGLCFGSFVNALVWRLHKQQAGSRKQASADKYSILHGRSMCVNCGHTLAWYDLLPVLSWLSLGGKCRYCRKAISWQYPVVESATAVLFVLSYQFWPNTLQPAGSYVLFALWLGLLVGFVALAVYDIRWMLLPDRMVFPMQVMAGAYVLVSFIVSGGNLHVIWDALLGVVFSAGIFYVLYQVSDGKWIGGGDVKLAVVLGLIVGGAFEALLMVLIASLLGSLASIPLLLKSKSLANQKLPFGPFLIAGTVIVFLFSASMLTWYNQQFLQI